MAPTDEVDVNRIPKLAVTGVLFLLLLIAGLGLKPGGSLTILEDSLQMSGHFGVFGILAFCAALAAPYLMLEAPFLVNTIYILQDVNEHNGGTLIIPGSHKLYTEGGGSFGEVPPAINLEAPAGTVMLMDGRVLHGGAVNRSDKMRYIITNSVVRPFIRQQESFHLTIRPDLLKQASEKFLWRCGFQATAARSMVEGYGYYGNGKQGDVNGSIVEARIAMDEGNYQRVGELRIDDLENRSVDFTLAQLQREHEPARDYAKSVIGKVPVASE